jgi:hypothetical protein
MEHWITWIALTALTGWSFEWKRYAFTRYLNLYVVWMNFWRGKISTNISLDYGLLCCGFIGGRELQVTKGHRRLVIHSAAQNF